MTLPVNEERPIFHPSTKREIIHAKDLRDAAFHGWACPGKTQEGIRTHRCSYSFEQPCSWFSSTLDDEDRPQKCSPKRSQGRRTHEVGQWLSKRLLSACGVQAAEASHPKAQLNRLTTDWHITWTALVIPMNTMRNLLASRAVGLFRLRSRTDRQLFFGGDRFCHRKAWERNGNVRKGSY